MRLPSYLQGNIKPKIAEVQCQRLTFEPGDRIIVRVNGRLDKDQHKRLVHSIEKWAGVAVEVLVIDLNIMDIEIEKRKNLFDEES
jgi:hypothetical protein